MTEVFAVVDLVSSITAFINVSQKVVARVLEYNSIAQEVPKSLQGTVLRLPLLVVVMTQIETRCGDYDLTTDAQRALLGVVEGCLKQIIALDGLIEEILPASTDSSVRRTARAITSVYKENNVAAILRDLRSYEAILTLYFCEKCGVSTALTPSQGTSIQ